MKKKLMLKTQRNDILEVIQEFQRYGLDPSEFQWIERESTTTPDLRVSALVHRPTASYFVFDFDQERPEYHWTECSPGEESSVESKDAMRWQYQCNDVKTWLWNILRETAAPDLWDAISQEPKLAEAASASQLPNTPFTAREQEHISAQLREIVGYLVKTQSLSAEHREFVRVRLDYLNEAAKRQGRQDWLHTAIGVLFTIVVGLGLAPSAARELFRFVSNALSQLLGGTPSLP